MPLAPTEEMVREARDSLPELPAARIERYEGIGLSTETASLLAADPETAAYFEQVGRSGRGRAEGRRQLGHRRARRGAAPGRGTRRAPPGRRSSPPRSPPWSAWSQEKKISHGSGKTVLAALVAEGGDPAAIVEREGLAQISDCGELESIVAAAIEANPEAAEQIRAGNGKAIGAIVGFVMKETKGRADGGEVNRLIKEKLGRVEVPFSTL